MQAADRAAMEQATTALEARHHEIHTLQTELQSSVLELTATWSGDTSRAFQAGYSKFDDEFELVKEGLERVQALLGQSLRPYHDTNAVGA